MIVSCPEGERWRLDVPLQRSFTGPRSVLTEDVASFPCKDLELDNFLTGMNYLLGTSYILDPSRRSLLKRAVYYSYDFGVAYALLRPRWHMNPGDAERNIEECRSLHDTARQKASVRGVPLNLMPRRMWDLWSNRVVPTWMVSTKTANPWLNLPSVGEFGFFAVSHPWVDAGRRRSVMTSINSYEWPVPIPAETTLEHIRTELLHSTQFIWLDVLCLRQTGANEKEPLRTEEWKTDIPTIGSIYAAAAGIVYYYSGLGLPFEIGDLDYERHWLKRAWTLQEINNICDGIIAGIPASCPLYCSRGLAGWQNEEDISVRRFCDGIDALRIRCGSPDLFRALIAMRSRSATCELDKINGMIFLLSGLCNKIVSHYNIGENPERAWVQFVEKVVGDKDRAGLLFYFPCTPPRTVDMPAWLPSWQEPHFTHPHL